MSDIPEYFRLNTNAKSDKDATILAPGVRFSILTSSFFRLEFSPEDDFEDRPSQIFWNRNQPVPAFNVVKNENFIEIETEHLHLRYKTKSAIEAFSGENLTIAIKNIGEVWVYGAIDNNNLGGTLRTLDAVDGSSPIEPGLVSRSGWSMINDTKGLVFNESGWLEPRNKNSRYEDIYFLGYGNDYQSCIRDYYKISGPPGMVPRWALGNWWSRYWEYSDRDLRDLLIDFREHEIPLAVCIIDMDWHITKTGNQSSGWTGYSWNRDLFPNPDETVNFIHDLGVKTGLNLHPADGIHPHESAYPQMAIAMGIDPNSEEPVPFDIENPKFIKPYFQYLHHPEEEGTGIDFWWMDWQQGNPTKLPGLNLLWWINHLHFNDLGRKKTKRSFLFSRWGGLGNHRYPIGFSGDTIISWKSLSFQPYLTATAANVGFGWWSHDIGGHMGGITDSELYTRWVQLGVFSPILRLHCTKNPFLERRPWGYDQTTYEVVKKSFQLRHALVPYIYSMAWRDRTKGKPLIRPMYYEWPEFEQAYICPNQYLFGNDIIAAPFVTPANKDTGLSRQVIWFPKGNWFNIFDGTAYSVEKECGEWKVFYGALDEIPVFAKSGAIIPMSELPKWGGLENPEKLTVQVFAGGNNYFDLYEDDGESSSYLDGEFAISKFILKWDKEEFSNSLNFTLDPVEGFTQIVPSSREYIIKIIGISDPVDVDFQLNGNLIACDTRYENGVFTINDICLQPSDRFQIKLAGVELRLESKEKSELLKILLKSYKLNNSIKLLLHNQITNIVRDVNNLLQFKLDLTPNQLRAILETILDAGVEYYTHTGQDQIFLWNNDSNSNFSFFFIPEKPQAVDRESQNQGESSQMPSFVTINPFKMSGILQVDYGTLLRGLLRIHKDEEANQVQIGWEA